MTALGPHETDPLLIPVPAVDSLSVAQTCGRACVWCAVTLATETAVELGRRSTPRFGAAFEWFPRSCLQCAAWHVYRVLIEHAQSCEQCADDPACCAEGSALRTTLKAARR